MADGERSISEKDRSAAAGSLVRARLTGHGEANQEKQRLPTTLIKAFVLDFWAASASQRTVKQNETGSRHAVQLGIADFQRPMPTLDDKIRKFRKQAEQAQRKGSRVREHVVLEMVAEELEEIDEVDASSDRLYTTAEAGERLGLEPRTVADWCNADRFPNAFKTGEDQKNGEKGGEWRIPARDVVAYLNGEETGDDSTDEPATPDDFEAFTS